MNSIAKYKIGQAFFNKSKETIFIIDSVAVNTRGVLYTVKYPLGRIDGQPFGRYYQDRIDKEFDLIEDFTKSSKTILTLFGK